MRTVAMYSACSALAATLLLGGCVKFRGPMYQGNEIDIQTAAAKARTTLGQSPQAACPPFGEQAAGDQLARARQKLQADIAATRAAADKLEIEYRDLLANWKPGNNDYLHGERDYAATHIAVRFAPSVVAWQDAAIASIAADRTPYQPTQSALHPGWGMRADLKTDIEGITGAAELVRSPALSDALSTAGKRISDCGVSYRPQYLALSVGPVRAHAAGMNSTAQIDRFIADLRLDSLAASSPVLADLRTELAQIRSDRAAAELAVVQAEQRRQQAERQRQEAERQRLAEQARQSQLLAAEAQRQAQQAAARAQAELDRNQETWRRNFAARNKPLNLVCEGRLYESSDVSNSITSIFGLRGGATRSDYSFQARFNSDYKTMEASLRSRGSPTRAGRTPIKFVGPSKIEFTVSYNITSPFQNGPSGDYYGKATIDFSSGDIAGDIRYGEGLQAGVDQWDGYCSSR